MKELRGKIFQTIVGDFSLRVFEQWLYQQQDLVQRMDDYFILDLFAFDYGQKYAFSVFTDLCLSKYGETTFDKWKIKYYLIALAEGVERGRCLKILKEFNDFGFKGYDSIQNLGYYEYSYEQYEYSGGDLSEVDKKIQQEALKLLLEISREELMIDDFRLQEFPYTKYEFIQKSYWELK